MAREATLLEDRANGIAERFDYNVEFKPVAEEDPQVGPPTQMGVFRQ